MAASSGSFDATFDSINEPLEPNSYDGVSCISDSNKQGWNLEDLFDGYLNETRAKVSMENFALIRVLGKGAYGKVFLVRKIGGHDSGQYYAMKVLKKTRVSQKEKTLEHTLSERQVLERLKGLPFLVNMVYAFQSETKLHIIMDFVRGGELFTHLCKRGRFDVPTSRTILAELVVALEQIHERGVIYRDLKLENILIDEEGHIKLTDFGLSKVLDEGVTSTNSYCGTIEYMSPEIVARNGSYTHCVDYWSLGVIAFELLTGCSPFTVDGDQNSTQDIAKRILTKRVPFPKNMDEVAKSFISALLERNPQKRLGSKGIWEIKQSPFFAGLNWDEISARKNEPFLRPNLSEALTDVRNFANEFTSQLPVFSPAEPPQKEMQSIFRGYSFIAPSVIFACDNVIGDECSEDMIRVLSAQNSPFFAKYRMDMSTEGHLGRGTFSICRRCHRLSDGKEFAVKIVSQRFAHHALREIRILEILNPYKEIVQFIEAVQDTLHFYIVMELLRGGELLQRLRKMEKFTEVQAAEIMSQLVAAVSHMHAKDIVHRDLKPENILFESESQDAQLRLVDFGFARILPSSSSKDPTGTLVTPCIGTLHYAAPEVLDMQDELPQYNQQCDLWSLGVILFTMLSGKVPFRARSQTETAADIISRIQKAEFSFDDTVWDKISESAKDLINGLLTVDPLKRLSLSQLRKHPWLAIASNAISESLVELQTPTILPHSADEIVNSTINALIVANREGFYLNDVETAPLLVKRRGLKRRNRQDEVSNEGGVSVRQQSQKAYPRKSSVGQLYSVPEETSPSGMGLTRKGEPKRPTTLSRMESVPEKSPAFTEYRDTKPPYLKYSRDASPTPKEI